MIALLLALPPVATAALALHLAARLAPGERAVVAAVTAACCASAVVSPQAPIHDAWTHFLHLRAALVEPARLLDLWDRPGFTLLYAGPSGLGIVAARLTSAILAATATGAAVLAARALGLPRPWAAGILVAAQFDFFGQGSSTMTELAAAAALAIAALGWAEARPWVVAAGLGWIAITRPEGPLFAAVGAAGLVARHRRAGIAPAFAALAPFVLYLAAGALVARDPLWWQHGNPYRGMVRLRFDAAQLAHSYFYEAVRLGQPTVLVVLEAVGAALAVARPARGFRFLLAPLAVSFSLLTFLGIGATDAWRESRYLVTVAPALGLLAAVGLEGALARFPRLAPPALLALAAIGGARVLLWHWRASVHDPAEAALVAYVGLLAAAALLWRRASPRVALAVVLAIPLVAAPPGAYGKLRPEPGAGPRTVEPG